jgi:hypothetical protein
VSNEEQNILDTFKRHLVSPAAAEPLEIPWKYIHTGNYDRIKRAVSLLSSLHTIEWRFLHGYVDGLILKLKPLTEIC